MPAPRRSSASRVVTTPRLPKPPALPKPPKTPKAPRVSKAAPAVKLSPDMLRMVFDQELRDLGLPPSTPEFMFAKDIGRRWRIDRAWPALRVAVEIEGGVHMRGRHLRPAGFLSDMDKYNELALRGWLLVRITYDMIRDGRARALVARALAARSTAR